MTTADFIKKTFNTTSTRERRCSSVFTDQDGNVYSYGYHYPLLFKLGGITFVNTNGYSNTTGRHILWARQAEPNAIPVKLKGNRLSTLTLYKIYTLLAGEIAEVVEQMSSKKRKDTAVYADLGRQLEILKANYATVESKL